MSAATIEVQYACDKCGLDWTKVNVPARVPEQDIKKWMDQTAAKVSRDHDARSPNCRITSISRLKIPILNEDGIGMLQRANAEGSQATKAAEESPNT